MNIAAWIKMLFRTHLEKWLLLLMIANYEKVRLFNINNTFNTIKTMFLNSMICFALLHDY